MITKTFNTYKFDELNDDQKATVLEKLSDINTPGNWWEYIYDDTKTIARLIGIEIKDIFFSGFSSQGDGACFTGEYSHDSSYSLETVKGHAPKDQELHRIAAELFRVQGFYAGKITATIVNTGRYSNENSPDILAKVEGEIASNSSDDESCADSGHTAGRSLPD